MSIEIILLPLAVAAISAWQAKAAADEAGRTIVAVGTRMRDPGLLQRALTDTGAAVTVTGEVITASWQSYQGRFARDRYGIWAAHFSGNMDEHRATELALSIDKAYGQHVQQEVLQRLKHRVPEVGMSIESETVEDDQSVTLVLNVNGGT